MRYISVFIVLSVLLLAALSAQAADNSKDERDEIVSLFGALSTPSIFTPATSEDLAVLLYGRAITGEGDVPDFDGDFRGQIDELQMFLTGRLGGLGLTLGFGQGSEFEFSQPFILSVDYKAGLTKEGGIIGGMIDAAVDAQYSMIVLPDEKNIGTSALGFGVFSATGLLSTDVLPLIEPYVGLSLNYVYLRPENDDFIGVLKLIPRAGAHIRLLAITVGTEIKFLKNSNLDSAWMWDIGAGIRF